MEVYAVKVENFVTTTDKLSFEALHFFYMAILQKEAKTRSTSIVHVRQILIQNLQFLRALMHCLGEASLSRLLEQSMDDSLKIWGNIDEPTPVCLMMNNCHSFICENKLHHHPET